MMNTKTLTAAALLAAAASVDALGAQAIIESVPASTFQYSGAITSQTVKNTAV